jgi:hypothetical protein
MLPIAKKFFIAALIYLILGLLAQAITVFDAWLGFNPLAYTAITATEQILLLGWLTQLGLALVYACWFPLINSNTGLPAETHNSTRNPNPETQSMVVFVLFNIGLPLVIIGQPGLVLFGGHWLGAVAAVGGLLQLFAGLVFVRQMWGVVNNKP